MKTGGNMKKKELKAQHRGAEMDRLQAKLAAAEAEIIEWREKHPSWKFALKDMTAQRDAAIAEANEAHKLADRLAWTLRLVRFNDFDRQHPDVLVALAEWEAQRK